MRDGTGLSVTKGQRIVIVRVKWTQCASSRVAPQDNYSCPGMVYAWDRIFCFGKISNVS